MYQIVDDKKWRGPSEAVSHNRICRENESLARFFEKQGCTTCGQNEELYVTAHIGDYIFNIRPSWHYENDMSMIDIVMPGISYKTISIKSKNFKKLFTPGSFFADSLLNYANAIKDYNIKIAPLKKSLESSEKAFFNNVDLAMALDETDNDNV